MARHRAKGANEGQNRFAHIVGPQTRRSAFDRSQKHTTTFDSGWLIPIWCDEALPGDVVSLTPSYFARLTTPLRPFMDGLYLDYQFFAVPQRLLHDNFVKMMGERTDPADHNDYTVPQIVGPGATGYSEHSLADYIGIPIRVANLQHSALWNRAYAMIYRDWYRDANLQDSPTVNTDDGPDGWNDVPIFRRGKRKDYFTGALPFAQRGDAVSLPLGTSADLTLTDGAIQGDGTAPTFTVNGATRNIRGKASTTDADWSGAAFGGAAAVANWADPHLELADLTGTVDLTTATAATINDIRVALATQHLLERDARGGGRYREVVWSHFGIQTDDVRLMRPEVLCTGSVPFQVAPLPATNEASTVDLGELGGIVTASQVGRGFSKRFSEHTILMGIVSVRAELTYQQGLERMFSRETRLDYFWPDLEGLGEQSILMKEIYAAAADPDAVWGYTPRYEEYRHRQNRVSGDMRSDSLNSLDVWHLALDFGSEPALNDAFIQEQPHIDRIVKVTTVDEILLDSFHKVRYVRPMARFGTPGMTRF